MVSRLLWDQELWSKASILYTTHAKDARPKSGKQLLSSLSNALKKAQPCDALSSCRAVTLQRLLQALLQREPNQHLRSCLLLITHLLAKDLYGLEEIDRTLEQLLNTQTQDPLSFLKLMMKLVSQEDYASAASSLVAVLLDRLEQRFHRKDLWVKPLTTILEEHEDAVELYRLYLLPLLLRRDPDGFVAVINHFLVFERTGIFRSSAHLKRTMISISLLQAGKELGLVVETDLRHSSFAELPIQLPLSDLRDALQHSERDIRRAGLSLLIDSPTTTRPLSAYALELIKHALPCLHADTDANSRSELFAVMQRLLDRMRTVTASLDKANNTSLLQVYKDFFTWHKSFLSWELRPSASYQRHISALRCLSILVHCGVDSVVPMRLRAKSSRSDPQWPFSISIFDRGLERLLVDMLMDSFNDVRDLAANLLSLRLSVSVGQSHSSSETTKSATLSLQHMCKQAHERAQMRMLASGRADQADAVAHLNSLIYETIQSNVDQMVYIQDLVKQIRSMIVIAASDLTVAVIRYPLHGLLTSLRYVLNKAAAEQITDKLITILCHISQDIWQVVKSTLCNDAPEGFLPEDMVNDESIGDLDTKNVLSYCWRALKEASLLDGLLLHRLNSATSDCALECSRMLIELTFTELAELRHRGAFSTVAQTWTICCSITNRKEGLVSLRDLNSRVLKFVHKATINTRRSAGLPSLLCGILAADQSDLLSSSFETLSEIARQPFRPDRDDESSLPQVHALNCIKEMLKSTALASESEILTTRALKLAADSLQSSAWAVRNCGLMLFRAVLDRCVGSNDSFLDHVEVKNKIDFGIDPTLLDVVLQLTETPNKSEASAKIVRLDSVFPALQLLQLAILPDHRLAVVQDAVLNLTQSTSWLVRDKAARTLTAICSSSRILEMLDAQQVGDQPENNRIHGYLLVLKHLSQSLQGRGNTMQLAQVQLILDIANRLSNDTSCPPLVALAQKICEAVSGEPSNVRSAEKETADKISSHLRAQEAVSMISDPEQAIQWMQARSLLLEGKALIEPPSPTLLADVADFIGCCSTILDEMTIFPADTVAEALQGMPNAIQHLNNSASHKHHMLKLCLLVYDLLNHDEEDVRVLSARTACTILSLNQRQQADFSVEPLVASRQLIALMTKQWSGDTALKQVIVQKAFGLSRERDVNVEAELRNAMQTSSDLFAVERQNLYLDEVLEVKTWAKAAMHVAIDVWHKEDLAMLTRYANSGLDALLTQATTNTDGPLGWSSTPEVFVLGFRIVYSCEVLFMLSEKDIRLPLKPSELRQKMISLLSQFQKGDVHCLWQREVQRIAAYAISTKTRSVGKILDLVVRRLDGEAS